MGILASIRAIEKQTMQINLLYMSKTPKTNHTYTL